MSGDAPQWSATNNATYKEIWVEPVNRFLGAVSIYTSYLETQSIAQEKAGQIQINSEIIENSSTPKYTITINGSGKHVIDVKCFNVTANMDKLSMDLMQNSNKEFSLELSLLNVNKPYVAVLTVDNNPDQHFEIVGSLNNSSIDNL
jgi:hypothetical protein